jgi:thioredoxin-like negative regulator of GroEL
MEKPNSGQDSSPGPTKAPAKSKELFWIKILIAALLAGAGWSWYHEYYGWGGFAPAAAEAEPVASAASAASAVTELTSASFDDFVAADKSPALVMFYETSCPYCRASLSSMERLSQEADGRYRVGKLNVQAEGAVAQRYPMRGVPTFILFSQGKPADAISGVPAETEEGIYQGLKSLIDKGLASGGHP